VEDVQRRKVTLGISIGIRQDCNVIFCEIIFIHSFHCTSNLLLQFAFYQHIFSSFEKKKKCSKDYDLYSCHCL